MNKRKTWMLSDKELAMVRLLTEEQFKELLSWQRALNPLDVADTREAFTEKLQQMVVIG